MRVDSKFKVRQHYDDPSMLVMEGTDEIGREFCVWLDRVWAGNLVQELDEWLSGGFTQRELRDQRVDRAARWISPSERTRVDL